VVTDLFNLSPGFTYCAQVEAANASGGATGTTPLSFTANLPDANTLNVSITGATTASVAGNVDPAGQSTSYQVGYGPSSSLWCNSSGSSGTPAHLTAQTLLIPQDVAYRDVSISIAGLTPGSSYCAALIATNASGSTNGGAVLFTAGLPNASTFDAIPTTTTSATIDGSVNPTGQASTYAAAYGLSSSTWCVSHGGSGTPTHTTPATSLGVSDDSDHNVSVLIAGLTPGSSYCAAITVTNGSGSSTGSTVSFTSGYPTTFTDSAVATGATSATVSGTIYPANQSTTYVVEYDTASSTWCSSAGSSGTPAHTTSATGVGGAVDSAAHTVNSNISALTPDTPYCAEVVATNATGTSQGGQVPFTAGLPQVFTSVAFATGVSSAEVDGSVNPSGQTTTYSASYNLSSSTWCTSGGSSGSPLSTTTLASLGATDSSYHNVAVNLSALTLGSSYCAEVNASNGTGNVTNNQVSFIAGLPAAQTTSASNVASSSATINGSVNPAGQSTTYVVKYDTTSSAWCSSDGASGTPANITPPTTLGATDTSSHAVSESIAGLTPLVSYCAEIAATNASGDSPSQTPVAFSTTQPPPGVSALSVGGISTSGATISGTVAPNGAATIYHFEYGTTTAYGTLTTNTSAGSSGAQAVSATLSGLTPGTTYHWQLVAVSAGGTTLSGDQTFATTTQTSSTPQPPPTPPSPPSPPNPPGPPAPVAPQISMLHLQPASFLPAKSGGSTSAKKTKKTGALVSYQDSQAGTTTFTVLEKLPGVKGKGGVCGKKPRTPKRGSKSCTYTATIGHFTHSDSAGVNSFYFTGRVGGTTLKAGKYMLQAVATNQAQLKSAAVTAFFQIK